MTAVYRLDTANKMPDTVIRIDILYDHGKTKSDVEYRSRLNLPYEDPGCTGVARREHDMRDAVTQMRTYLPSVDHNVDQATN